MSLGNIVLQLFCCYYSWYLYRYFQCWIYCIFTLVLSEVCVHCPIWLFSVVPSHHVFLVYYYYYYYYYFNLHYTNFHMRIHSAHNFTVSRNCCCITWLSQWKSYLWKPLPVMELVKRFFWIFSGSLYYPIELIEVSLFQFLLYSS